MAYDVERRAGAWVSVQAGRRVRQSLIFAGVMLAAFLFSALLWLSGRHWAAAASYGAFLSLAWGSSQLLDAALPWRKGANAEEAVGAELDELRREHYVVMHDFMFGGEGNIDHLVSGPNGVVVVETKFKSYTPQQLAKVKRQAARLHDELGCWVTPIICAGVRKRTFTHQKVLVAGRGNLAAAIRNHAPRPPVDPDRLARFADRLT